jgi:hypothetical protein
MNSVATIILILVIVFAAFAIVRMMGGPGVGGPVSRPTQPRERIVEREVERPQTERVVEREATPPPVEPQRRVVEREVVREDPDIL